MASRLTGRTTLLFTETRKTQGDVVRGGEDRESGLLPYILSSENDFAHEQIDGHLKPWGWARSPRA